MHDRHLVVLLRVSGFQWDEGNRRKIRDRDISEQECEQVFANGPGLYEDVKAFEDGAALLGSWANGRRSLAVRCLDRSR